MDGAAVGPYLPSLAFAPAFTGFWWLVARAMDRSGWHLRIWAPRPLQPAAAAISRQRAARATSSSRSRALAVSPAARSNSARASA